MTVRAFYDDRTKVKGTVARKRGLKRSWTGPGGVSSQR